MEMKWYYAKDGQQAGPFTFANLQELALTGAITKDDLVWQQGTKDWVKAQTIIPIFNSTATTITCPPLPPVLNRPDQNKETSVVGGSFAKAGQLVSKNSHRGDLGTALSAEYLALGKELFAERKQLDDFATEYQQLDDVSAKLEAVRQPVVASGQSYLDQAKLMAAKAKRFAEEKVLVYQFDSALKRLGEAAYKKFGQAVGSGEASSRIAALLLQIEANDLVMNQISSELKAGVSNSFNSGSQAAKSFFSKRHNQIIGGVAAVLLSFVVLKSGCSSNNGSPSASSAPKNSSSDGDSPPKSYSVSKGAFSGSISVEVSSYESISLSSLSYSSSKINFKITHDPIEGGRFRHGKDFYRFTAYDKDGVTLKESFILHEAIGPGETVLGRILLTGVGDVARVVIHR